MALINQLNTLRLDYLDHGWVQAIYNSEFLEFDDLPPEYENIMEALELTTLFKDIIRSTENWLNSEEIPPNERTWAQLSHLIPYKKILAIIAYYLDRGCKNIDIREYRNEALLASRVYYKLLSIPGYKAYNIYHSQLFAQSLTCLVFPKTMSLHRSNLSPRALTSELNSLLADLVAYVADLKAVVGSLHLSPTDMNFEDILSNLVDVTSCDIVTKNNIDKTSLQNIIGMILGIIDGLLQTSNKEPNEIAIMLLFKCMIPKLTASCMEHKSSENLTQSAYVTYSFLIITKYGTSAIPSYALMIEYLCYTADGLERYEVRERRAELVVGLMSALTPLPFKKIFQWIIELSNTAKLVHRQVAVEIMSHMIEKDIKETPPEHDRESADTLDESQPTNTAVEQMNDSSPDSGDNIIMACQQTSAVDGPGLPLSDVERLSLLQERRHRVPYSEIFRAVFDRVNDDSGSLRQRALGFFTYCLTIERPVMVNAIKEVNGPGAVPRLLVAGARSACDERAVVRKAAALLVLRLLCSRCIPEPRPDDVLVLVNLCRDASIIVRTAAISGLGELVVLQPTDVVVEAFLTGPMHQVTDPEAKVQEQVLNLIEDVLIRRVSLFRGPDKEDPLPWLILAGILRRKMKRHLQKICFMMSKSSQCINHRLVDKLSSHLGALSDERDVQCLLLLTCVARHVDYPDVGFVLDYYYKLTDNEDLHDVRALSLTLDLLGSWSRFVLSHDRTLLRDHLVRRLAAATDDGCRIWSAQLAAQLDFDNLSWATEMMQLSERRVAESGDVLEALRAADLSLVAPAPPSPVLLKFFLNALNDPPPEWDEVVYGSLVAGAGRMCVREREAAAQVAPLLAALLSRPREPLNVRLNCFAALSDICARYVTAPLLAALLSRPREPLNVRLNCFAALSDICARYVTAPLLAALLSRPREPLNVRLNCFAALSDICARYTCIVEPLLGSMCGCLFTEAPAPLRRKAARELTRLLLGGFLRLRTPLYYRYCALLADEDDDVREPAEYYVTCGLTTDSIYHHFVECVLYYNHEEKDRIDFDDRQLIYDVMLQRMSIVQKLNIQCRLAREVLEHAADLTDEGDGELPPEINAALLDTITLLCGPRMKLPKKQKPSEVNDIDELQERVTNNIVSHKMKITVAEVLVPAVLRLHSRLKSRGGQINTYLIHIASDLLKDYELEIKELFEDNVELMKSIQLFQETIGLEVTFGNVRNLVTSTAPAEPDTPRAPRKRPRPPALTPRKRALRI
ncbi:condensin-2 complex subunit D3-like isoform X2 [Helicoverpa zea]|uniref:condensin-2 complex subunit D3-like isoform X2 n=1 Tax=Helicoverpa zea TaxID=7113 RepID=UPI001F58C6B0|nr:condensin-2 complex subunit D3-like isoform X2 [Helicoverpa zea]